MIAPFAPPATAPRGAPLPPGGPETAVEEFSRLHAAGRPDQARHYSKLLPAAPPGPGKQYAFEVDLDRCTGCKACVNGCHSLNGLDAGEAWRSVGVVERRGRPGAAAESGVPESAGPESDGGAEARTLGAWLGGDHAPLWHQHLTSACHHCLEPSCLQGCPVEAYTKDAATGVVRHLDDQCFGCRYCTWTCPYGAPRYNPRLGIVRKCDMCTDRLAVGEAPACVQSCPNEAIRIQVVDMAEVEAGAESRFGLSGAPPAGWSLPTTRHISKRPVGSPAPGLLGPWNSGPAATAAPEWSLVIMLVATQLGVGLWTLSLGAGQDGPGAWAARLAGWGLSLLGLGAVFGHLGRPAMAFRAVLGWRHSWLSREAVSFGAWVLLAAAALGAEAMVLEGGLAPSLLSRLGAVAGPFGNWAGPAGGAPADLFAAAGRRGMGSGGAVATLAGAAALVGWAGIVCSARLYQVTAKRPWRGWGTPARFVLTALWLGALARQAVAAWPGMGSEGAPAESIALWAVAASLLAVLKLGLEAPDGWARGASRGWNTAALRAWWPGRISAVLVSVALVWVPVFASAAARAPGPWWTVALAAALAAVAVERHLFFTAAPDPAMPGSAPPHARPREV